MTGDISAKMAGPSAAGLPTAAAQAVYNAQGPITLREGSPRPLTELAAMQGVYYNGGSPAPLSDAFGRNGSNLVIRLPGIYLVTLFSEFTRIDPASGFIGSRLFQVGGGFTLRLWKYKDFGTKDELAGSVSNSLVVTQPVELAVENVWDGRPINNETLQRIYANLIVQYLAPVAGAGPIV